MLGLKVRIFQERRTEKGSWRRRGSRPTCLRSHLKECERRHSQRAAARRSPKLRSAAALLLPMQGECSPEPVAPAPLRSIESTHCNYILFLSGIGGYKINLQYLFLTAPTIDWQRRGTPNPSGSESDPPPLRGKEISDRSVNLQKLKNSFIKSVKIAEKCKFCG